MNPSTRTWDLLVLGGGTAGIVAAKTAVGLGSEVLVIERERTGGDCLWTGCVPSKALLAAASSVASARDAAKFGIHTAELSVDFPAVMRHVHSAIQQVEPVDSQETLERFGISILHGDGQFIDGRTLQVDQQEIRFRAAIIAVGAQPAVPPIPGLLGSPFLTSENLWKIQELPKRLVILGAGSIGCELGQAFARLGSMVTLVDMAPRILPREDQFAAQFVAKSLKKDGVEIITCATVSLASIGNDGKGFLRLDDGGGDTCQLDFDHLLVASGRTPRTSDLGLDLAGVELTKNGFLKVDASLRTTNKRIWAAGDVTGHPQFTHVAGVHGSVAASNAVLGLRRKAEVATIPRVTFTHPEVAAVGVSTDSLGNDQYDVVQLMNDEVDRAITEYETEGFTKITIDKKGRIIGATIVGPRASETLSELTLAVRLGLRTRDVASTIHPYPTFSDAPWKIAIADVQERLQAPPIPSFLRLLRRITRARLPA
jgi:pyruvate/2-oxoglutarate dehydrogenase complex dihydrolipoamide dehydrogenase (E3) component